jgi:hypothetical protein
MYTENGQGSQDVPGRFFRDYRLVLYYALEFGLSSVCLLVTVAEVSAPWKYLFIFEADSKILKLCGLIFSQSRVRSRVS